jgi:hypothetical protein
MSQLQVNRINDASGGVLAPISSVMRNRIINGAMVIDQRANGASTSVQTTTSYATCDRWAVAATQNSKFSVQRSTTAPSGFTNSLLATSSSAYSVLSGDYFALLQQIEGFNIADLGWGTAAAKTVTLSFQVRSSLTGTFGGSITGYGNSRSYPFTYSVPAANTWTTISVTVPGDTTGTWLTNNSGGIGVWFGLGVGSTSSGTAGAWAASNLYSATGAVSLVGTSGATINITGVQLEVGTQATSFEYRQYGTELALCQRYYEKSASTDNNLLGFCYAANNLNTPIQFLVEKRAAPTLIRSGTYTAFVNGGGNTLTYSAFGGGTRAINITWTGGGITAGQAFSWSNPNNPQIAYDAEL